MASATLGLVFSVICGVMFVNIATHRGWVKRERIDTAQEVKISIRLVEYHTVTLQRKIWSMLVYGTCWPWPVYAFYI